MKVRSESLSMLPTALRSTPSRARRAEINFLQPRGSLDTLSRFMTPMVHEIFVGQSPFTFINSTPSVGRKRAYTADQEDLIDHFIEELWSQQIIVRARRSAFLAFPFLVPKDDGTH